ncbi:hypothetical protein EI94DRAFT_1819298 [Lactarius quietus]|nr:hypothetical protein EI94DRAFT_1819298 [Lactarius quietus]
MVVPNQQSNILQPRNGKHTFTQVQDTSDAHVSSSSAMQANPVKRAQTVDNDDNEELPSKAPNKFSESLAIKQPEWAASGSSEPANSASQESYLSVNDADLCAITGHRLDSAVSTAGPSVQDANSGWPVITKLVYSSGTNRLMLTSQRPIIHTVIQEAIDNLWAALLFNTAFPNVCFTLDMIKDCLLNTANHLKPRATEILNQLENDQHYLMKITPLLCAHICLICSKVKEHCNTVTMASFLALGQEQNVIDYVSKQLLQHTYMFPGAAFANALSNLVMHSQPHRNKHIITVIWDMYFTGGSASFAKKYNYLFLIFEGCEGEMIKVPVLMVVLVATALYAMIYEWHTGEQQVMEFSANLYLDVYNGHVNTLNHIRDKHPGAFHLLMADIYVRAS